MMSGRKSGSNILEYRALLFNIKAVKSAGMGDASANYSKYNPLAPNQKDKTPFGIITTIKGISKSAVERNRVRTRFKEAVRLALTRDIAGTSSESEANSRNGSREHVDLPAGELIEDAFSHGSAKASSKGYHYLATLTSGIYAEPMLSLVQQARAAISELTRQAQNGGHAQKRFQPSHKSHVEKRSRASPQRI